jgi:uncharacterized damage-inducible protein DinB
MNRLEYAKTKATYNRWMNDRIYAACAKLADQDRKRDVGAFFKSIHGTLNHILVGDRVWLGRFTEVPFTVRSLDQELYADFTQLRAQRHRTDEDIIAWVTSRSGSEFQGQMSYMSTINPQPRTYPFWLVVVHFFNHQVHHRGQVTALLMQNGIDPGVTDLIWLPDVQPGAAK